MGTGLGVRVRGTKAAPCGAAVLGREMLSTCSPASLQIQDGAGPAGGQPTEILVSELRQGLDPVAKCSGYVRRERGSCSVGACFPRCTSLF